MSFVQSMHIVSPQISLQTFALVLRARMINLGRYLLIPNLFASENLPLLQ